MVKYQFIHSLNLFFFCLEPGPPDEDELFETIIEHTNRVYEVTLTGLEPCVQYWGCPMKYELLNSNQVGIN